MKDTNTTTRPIKIIKKGQPRPADKTPKSQENVRPRTVEEIRNEWVTNVSQSKVNSKFQAMELLFGGAV